MVVFLVLLGGLIAIACTSFYLKARRLKREAYIREYVFPMGLFKKLSEKHPQLSQKDCELVARGLRKFFLAYLRGGRQFVSMPSQVVDDLWHEFILHTKGYAEFNRLAFGRFLHHSPAATLSTKSGNEAVNAGLRRVWYHACMEEKINPGKPSRLPLLFALDKKLAITGGFVYVTDCHSLQRLNGNVNGNINGNVANAGGSAAPYCGSDFSSTSFDGSTNGYGESSSTSQNSDADGGGGGGGDSGGGCGGGCGGGGD